MRNAVGRPGTPREIRVDDMGDSLPESVFVLTAVEEGREGFERWETERHEKMLVAYSSVERLLDECGAGQPWIEVSAVTLEQVCWDHGVTVVALDMSLPIEPRYPEPTEEQPDLPMLEPMPEGDGHVYLPSRPVARGQRTAELELREHEGQLAALVFTSPEALHEGCGPYQPWVKVRVEDLDDVVAEAGAAGTLFNAVLADDARYSSPVRNWTRR